MGMEMEVVAENPVLQLRVDCGTHGEECNVFASQLVNVEAGDIIVSESAESNLCGETVLVTVAHRTSQVVVLLVEKRGWTENYGHVCREHETRLVAVELP